MFTKFNLNLDTNRFEELSKSANFETITRGRKGANLVDCKEELIPIVRTTTVYNQPVQNFLPIHHEIIRNIKTRSDYNDLELNNAMIEIYDSQYCKMGFHSDQSLDLAPNSYICIFSCYDDPASPDKRKLVIKDKITEQCDEIRLEHNSVIVFSLSTNSRHFHKIILEKSTRNTQWLGITFRLSKTFIRFVDEIPYFHSNNKVLRIVANKDEAKEFYKHRSEENKKTEYNYPEIDYTISISDTLPVHEVIIGLL
jgi:hypothetical protein